jgi:iron complex transport system substrate-binding protein
LPVRRTLLVLALALLAAAHGRARIVVLMPSLADDLYAIGAGPQIVGVSAYTDAPEARGLPRVGDATAIDAEEIVALRPTLVVGIPAQERMLEPVRRAGIRVVLLPDAGYPSIFADLRELGALTGRSAHAGAVVARLQRETAALHAQTRAFKRRPSVFVVLGTGPIWTAGAESYIATLISLAGGTDAANGLHAAYGEYSAEALLRAQPDLLVADRDVHLEAVLGREPWRSLRAVREGHVAIIDRAADLERPDPSYVEGLRWLIERLAPLAQ